MLRAVADFRDECEDHDLAEAAQSFAWSLLGGPGAVLPVPAVPAVPSASAASAAPGVEDFDDEIPF